MVEFLQSITLFPLLLSLGTYQVGVWCQKKTKLAICNPLLIATVLSIGVLLLVTKNGKFDSFRHYCWGAGVIAIFLTAIL